MQMPSPGPSDAFSDLVLDTLRLHETIAAAQNAPAHERAWFLQGTRQTLFVAGLHWMIRHDEACELLTPLPLAFLPHMPPWFCGLAHWQGRALPVIDLALFWQLPATAASAASAAAIGPQRKLLVLGHGDDAAGVYLDRLPGHVRLSEVYASPPDAAARRGVPLMQSHMRGHYVQGKKSWFDVDVQALLAELERRLSLPANQPIASPMGSAPDLEMR